MGYKYLQSYIKLDRTQGYRFCGEEEADFIVLPITEYHGLRKAVRIVSDRAFQQIEKSKADPYGFRVLRAGKAYYREGRGMVYLVTKETPFSIRMRLDEAWALIEARLREIYYWTDELDLEAFAPPEEAESRYDTLASSSLHASDYPKIVEAWDDRKKKAREWLVENSKRGRAIKAAVERYEGMLIIGIAKVSACQAQGVYEVSYWCTQPL